MSSLPHTMHLRLPALSSFSKLGSKRVLPSLYTTSNVPALPVELWIHIIFFSDRPTLHNLSLTSRTLQSLARPQLFDRIRLEPTYGLSQIQRLHKLFDRCPEGTTWPKSVYVWDGISTGKVTEAAAVKTITSLLMRMRSLREVRLSGFYCSVVLYNYLCQLPTMEYLHLDIGCVSDSRPTGVELEPAKMNITRLVVENHCTCVSSMVSRLALAPRLREMEVVHSVMRGLYKLPATTLSKAFQCLTSLKLPRPTADQLPLLLDFLTYCSNLTALSISGGNNDDYDDGDSRTHFVQLAPGTTPLLETFSGFLEHAKIFAEVCPIEDLEICSIKPRSEDEIAEILRGLSRRGASTVKRLAFTRFVGEMSGTTLGAALNEVFPGLEDLVYDGCSLVRGIPPEP